MMVLCMAILLLTGSNITNLLLGVCLLFIFIFQSDRDKKSLIIICFLLLIVFLAKVSPQNNQYVSNILEEYVGKQKVEEVQNSSVPVWLRPDSILTPIEQKQKTAVLYLDSLSAARIIIEPKRAAHTAVYHARPAIPTPDINSDPYQHKSEPTRVKKDMVTFVMSHENELPFSSRKMKPPILPGKIIAWNQTLHYFIQHPFKLITGTGIGNFSSKLAFKSTGLNIAGGYPQKYIYLNDAFVKNHLDLYLYFFTKDDGLHSITNNPNSVYDQLISEYGLAGIAAFFIFYVGFFIKRKKYLTYGIPLLLFLSGLFFVDYWFEQLSAVVFFELLMFLNIKESEER
jgi:O-Antigen ligase.